MKHTFLLLLLSQALALPISTELARRTVGRGLFPVISKPTRPFVKAKSSNGTGNGKVTGLSVAQPKDPSTGKESRSWGGSNGKPVTANDLSKFPHAKAAAHTYQTGRLITNTGDDLGPEKVDVHYSNGIRDRQEVSGPVSASASAQAYGNGGASSASGYAKASARLMNNVGRGSIEVQYPGEKSVKVSYGTKDPIRISGPVGMDIHYPKEYCYDCMVPGQNPIKIETGLGRPVSVKATNKFPHRGPVQIHASQDGPGYTSAEASNRL